MDFEGLEQGFAPTKNGRMFYRRSKARGKPIIFLHGIGGNSNSWNKLVPLLPEGMDICLVDLLGHGRSDAPEIEYDVMMQVEALEQLAESLGMEEPTIFGHSYGGWMAVHYSLRQKIAGLMIEDSAGIATQQLGIEATGKRGEYVDHMVAESVKIGASERVVSSAMNNMMKYALTYDIMSKVPSRAFLIWGEDDSFVPIMFGREMHDAIKGSDFLSIPGAGHVPHRTKPEIVAGAISRFCKL